MGHKPAVQKPEFAALDSTTDYHKQFRNVTLGSSSGLSRRLSRAVQLSNAGSSVTLLQEDQVAFAGSSYTLSPLLRAVQLSNAGSSQTLLLEV
jgi:hypothetical protein